MKTGALHVFYYPTDIEFVNITLDSLLRQDDDNLIVHAFFDQKDHNIASLLKNYHSKKLRLHELAKNDASQWKNAASSKGLVAKYDLYTFIGDGCIFGVTWASTIRKAFKNHKNCSYAVMNDAVLDQDGSVIASYSFDTFAEWLMAKFLTKTAPQPVIVTRSEQESDILNHTELPQNFFISGTTIFIKDCLHAQRKVHRNNTSIKQRDIGRFIKSAPRDELISMLSGTRQKKLLPLFVATLKELPATSNLRAHRILRRATSIANKEALNIALKSSTQNLVNDYFIIDPEKED